MFGSLNLVRRKELTVSCFSSTVSSSHAIKVSIATQLPILFTSLTFRILVQIIRICSHYVVVLQTLLFRQFLPLQSVCMPRAG
ncbi:hypothetical protein L218DRAFT_730097 [Marasmius fiardii PR-910]|nr:hypothetical protein L218DRAFT_730097 [Marasmius fiardii PR-910]